MTVSMAVSITMTFSLSMSVSMTVPIINRLSFDDDSVIDSDNDKSIENCFSFV